MRQVQKDTQKAVAPVTRRRAYRSWQTLEAGLETIRQEVEGLHLMARDTAPEFGPAGPPPLLQAASAFAGRPLDPATLRLRQRLASAFALFGTSFWRRPPLSLRLDLLEYADRIQMLSRQGRELQRRLHLALDLVHILQRRRPGRSSPWLRLTFTDPEAMRFILLLEEKQVLTRRITESALRRTLQTRIAACRSWLVLLGPHLPAETIPTFRASLADVAAPLENPSDQSFSRLTALHQQLDQIIEQIPF